MTGPRPREDGGWAGAVLSGVVLPLLVVVFLVCLASGGVVYAWLRADIAADDAAAAAARGGDPVAAARASLSSRLAATARVEVADDGTVVVRVDPLPDAVVGDWPPVAARSGPAPEAAP